ncbi:MAG: DUF1338 domain-containing protein [Acidobacteriota bacterium]
MTSNTSAAGPHGRLAGEDPKEQFTAALLDGLWYRYRDEVEYVQVYEQVVADKGAVFENDHIAFRTLAVQEPCVGRVSLSRLFEALGFRAAGNYYFEDKWLAATHFQHPNPGFPKLFISELQVWRLPEEVRRRIQRVVAGHRPPLPLELLARLEVLDDAGGSAAQEALDILLNFFSSLPWEAPPKEDVLKVNEVSQYGAWVLVHGYKVNHFTASINSHRTPDLDDIDKTVAALRAAGVPMKDEVEGAPGSKLRQTATAAVVKEVTVREGDRLVTMPWTYAYFELAERGEVADPETGRRVRFEGFLGPQAAQLFEMTRR